MKWWEMIISKMFSARFVITVLIGATYCKLVNHCVYFYLASMTGSPKEMEAFVTGLIMGFSSIAMFVIKSYFDRVDRPDTSTITSKPIETAPASPIQEPKL